MTVSTAVRAARRAALARRVVVLALWCSLLVAATGVGLWAGELGAGLLAGGLATAALLLWVVDLPDRKGST